MVDIFQQFRESRNIPWMIVTNDSSNTKAAVRKNLEESTSSVLSQLPSVLVSLFYDFMNLWYDFITYRIDSFRPTIMNQTILSYSSPSSSQPIISPKKYSWLFCKYISSKIRHTSSEFLFFSIHNTTVHLTASIEPLLILFSNDKDDNRKSWSKF